MPPAYRLMQVFTRESAKHKGRPLSTAITKRIHDLHIGARVIVLRGVAGCCESG